MLAIGIDIGGTKIAAGVVDENGRVLETKRQPTPAQDTTALEETVAHLVRELRRSHDAKAVGIGAAGFVDSARRNVIFSANLAWRNHPLAENVENLVDLPVVVENDANAAGWAEYRFGAGQGCKNMLTMTLGTGLGGAVIINGGLVRGAGGFAAEIAHVCAVPDGHPCGCGQRGCLEQYTSGRALVREARTQAATGEEDLAPLLAAAGGSAPGIDGPLVSALAAQGDAGSIRLLRELGTWVGHGAASLSAVLDPEIIVLGGGVSESGPHVIEAARKACAEKITAAAYRGSPRIELAQMGNGAGLVGAADLARTEN
ncbi:ROK family glucokinase [Dermabacteraceae bacterium P13103]